jgi:1-deoxy-D-xylulose-5-phosphate synthase
VSEYLSRIKSPADVKKLGLVELERLAEEIRARLIAGVAKTGGHIGPNLGVVELTIALHYVFDTPADSFVFDVSHQSYVHKLLTGREPQFETIRQPGGLNGFMLRTESEHDSFGAGHAGTALSAALGMAVARDMSGGKEHVIALAGDAAFTNGISFEALNNIAQTKRLIIVLNDNEWSIDKNVGAIAEYFHKIATNPTYVTLHDRAAGLLQKFGGKAAVHIAKKAEEAAKGIVGRGMIFEEFGLNYYGPVDGHNLPMLIETFKFLKRQNKPVVLHALTQKGRGFQPALEQQKKFHGLGPFDPETGGVPNGAKPATIGWSRSPRRCPTAPRSTSFGRTTRNGTSMSALRRSMQCSSPRVWRPRGIGRSARSTRRFYSVPSTRSCTTWRCRSCRWSSAWTAAA